MNQPITTSSNLPSAADRDDKEQAIAALERVIAALKDDHVRIVEMTHSLTFGTKDVVSEDSTMLQKRHSGDVTFDMHLVAFQRLPRDGKR